MERSVNAKSDNLPCVLPIYFMGDRHTPQDGAGLFLYVYDAGGRMIDEQPKKLNKAQEVFIDEYLLCFNATEAYSRAYPKAKRTTAGANGHELLKKTEIQNEIQQRLSAVHMNADEALKLQSDIARGDITEFFTQFGNLDFDKLRDSGKGRLVKKIKQRTITKIGKGDSDPDTEILETEIELYPADTAQERILKIHGRLKGDAPVINVVKGYIGWSPENWKNDDKEE